MEKKLENKINISQLKTLEVNNPNDASKIVEFAEHLKEKFSIVDQNLNQLVTENERLVREKDLFSRHTLSRTVLALYVRNQVSTLSQFNSKKTGVKKVPVGLKPRPRESKEDENPLAAVDKIFRSGWMDKEGKVRKSWKRRLFVLFGSEIQYYENPTDSKPKGVIKLETCTLSPVLNRPDAEKPCMELTFGSKKRKWHFTSTVLSDNRKWFASINNRIETLSYLHRCEASKDEADQRLVKFLNHVPASSAAIAAAQTDQDHPDVANVKHFETQESEEWPESIPLTLDNRKLSLNTVSVLARILSDSLICPGGGVSELSCVKCGLTNVELEVLGKGISDSDFNGLDESRETDKAGRLRFQMSLPSPGSHNQLKLEYKPIPEIHGVRKINFSHNVLVGGNDETARFGVKELARLFTVSQALEEVILDNCSLDDECMRIFGEALSQAICPLKKLVLSNNTISHKGLVHLVKGLKEACKNYIAIPSSDKKKAYNDVANEYYFPLEELCLNKNQIGKDGGFPISELLDDSFLHLKKLDISDNEIGEEVVFIVQSLKKNRTLEEFRFLNTVPDYKTRDPNSKVGKSVVEMMQMNQNLKVVHCDEGLLEDSALNVMRILGRYQLGK